MKLRRFYIAAAWFVFLACFAQTPVFAKDQWLKIESKNFQLYGNASEKDIRGAATRLEQFREAFQQIFPNLKYNSAIPTIVIIFKDDETFSNFKPVDADGKRSEWAGGYFQSGEDVNYIALSIEGDESETYRTIYHEYIHSLVNNDLGLSNIPAWFSEGIAEYYEQLTIENDQKVTLGAINEDNLELLRQNKLIPFETFFSIDNYSLNKQGTDGVGLFYAQAWALTHFLIHDNNGTRNPQLSKFLNLLLSGEQSKAAFAGAFQTDYAALEIQLKKYIEQRVFKTQIVNLKNKLTNAVDLKIAPVSDAEAKATLGDLLYHSERVAEAEAILKEAVALDPSSPNANAVLGVVKAARKSFVEAKKYLEKAIALDNKNYLNYYRYAYALSRQGMTEFGFVSDYTAENAVKMREALDKAIALNPNFPESYSLYAFINYVRDEDIDEAVEYLNKAIAAAPGDQWYQVRLAELYLRREDFRKARQIARKVSETAPDEHLRVYADNTLSQINSYEAQLESIKNHKSVPTDVTDKILTEEEIKRLNEQAMLEAINQSLRRPKADEKRVLGYLSKIECGKVVEYTVKIDDKTFKLSSENFDALFLMTYSADSTVGELGCGTIEKDVLAVITYRPKLDKQTRYDGEMIAVELVPKNFKWLN